MHRLLPWLAVVALGCSNDLSALYASRREPVDAGKRADASSGTDASDREISFPSTGCAACVAAGCATELDHCSRDDACRDWERCVAGCAGDGACEHGCVTTAGQTNRMMGEISTCTFQHCIDECHPSGFLPAYSSGCAAAYWKNCEAQDWSACAHDENCLEFGRCMFETNCLVRGGMSSVQDSEPSHLRESGSHFTTVGEWSSDRRSEPISRPSNPASTPCPRGRETKRSPRNRSS